MEITVKIDKLHNAGTQYFSLDKSYIRNYIQNIVNLIKCIDK